MSDPVAALTLLRDRLDAATLGLDLPGAGAARAGRDELVDQIDDYLLPRIRRLDAPLLAVVGGSTGSGKSTLVNTLAGRAVSPAGVLRPTTRAPVLVCHPTDRSWFVASNILPGLPRINGERTTGAADGPGSLRIVVDDDVPPGVGLLDAPDIDSIEEANHELARQLLGAADLWLFVTTAARYADAVPWGYLARAAERATALAVVVNRIPPGAATEVTDHLADLLVEHGLGDADLLAIDEGPTTDDGLLVGGHEALGEWLTRLAGDHDDRMALVRSTVTGTLASLPQRVARVADAVRAEDSARIELLDSARRHHDAARTRLVADLDDGRMLRGEVLDAWREHVGVGEWAAGLQSRVGRWRDRLSAALRRRPPPPAAVPVEVRSKLAAALTAAADRAALDTVEDWRQRPGGRDLLTAAGVAGGGRPDRVSDGFDQRADDAVAQWQTSVLDMVLERGGAKLAVARGLSWGINGVGVAVMLAVFSQTGGLTGGEAAVAGGTAALSQTVLSAVFGDQAIRDLVRDARAALLDRVDDLLAGERARFDDLVAPADGGADADDLTRAARDASKAPW